MWVEELKNGKYKMAERYADPLTGKPSKVSVTMEKNTAKSRKEAQAILSEKIRAKLEKGAVKDVTFGELVELYLAEKEKALKQSSYSTVLYSCRAIVAAVGGDIPCSRLTAGYVRSAFIQKGNSAAYINGRIAYFKMVMRWGYQNDYVKDVSFLGKIRPLKDGGKKKRIEEKFLERDELKKVLASMDDRRWRDFTEFLVLSGLRINEATALEIADIDLEAREIHVTKNYDYRNKATTTPKTAHSTRDVYIQDQLLPLARRLRQEALLARMATGSSLLFQRDGRHYGYHAYNRYLKRHALAAVGRELTPHSLRHTHASLMAGQGMGVDMLCRRLGHEDDKVTREIYIHVTERLKEREREEIRGVKIL